MPFSPFLAFGRPLCSPHLQSEKTTPRTPGVWRHMAPPNGRFLKDFPNGVVICPPDRARFIYAPGGDRVSHRASLLCPCLPRLFSTAKARTSNSKWPFGFMGSGGRLPKARRGRVYCFIVQFFFFFYVQFIIITISPSTSRPRATDHDMGHRA